jgi:hypothetical protein
MQEAAAHQLQLVAGQRPHDLILIFKVVGRGRHHFSLARIIRNTKRDVVLVKIPEPESSGVAQVRRTCAQPSVEEATQARRVRAPARIVALRRLTMRRLVVTVVFAPRRIGAAGHVEARGNRRELTRGKLAAHQIVVSHSTSPRLMLRDSLATVDGVATIARLL